MTRLLSRCLRWVGRVLTRPFRRKPKWTGPLATTATIDRVLKEVFDEAWMREYERRSREPSPVWVFVQKRPEGKQ